MPHVVEYLTGNPMGYFRVYNATIVSVVCLTIAWRRDRLSWLWLLFPLLVMADSDLSWFREQWFLVGSRMAWWRRVFSGDLTYSILVSLVESLSCIVLYRKYGRRAC